MKQREAALQNLDGRDLDRAAVGAKQVGVAVRVVPRAPAAAFEMEVGEVLAGLRVHAAHRQQAVGPTIGGAGSLRQGLRHGAPDRVNDTRLAIGVAADRAARMLDIEQTAGRADHR